MDDDYSKGFSDSYGYPMVRVYSLVSTKITEHSNNLSLFRNIVDKSNYHIENYESNKKTWIYIKKNQLSLNFRKLPFEIMNYIEEFLDEKLSSKEINWILNKSYVNYPFECLSCFKLMKLDLKSFKGSIWYYSLIYKNKYCEECSQLKEEQKIKYKE